MAQDSSSGGPGQPPDPAGARFDAVAYDATLAPGVGHAAPVPPAASSAALEPTAAALDQPLDASIPRAGLILSDRYRLERRLGAGGMGEVWAAQHVVIGKPVAIKILTTGDEVPDEAHVAERFMREARVIASVHHENVVDISDFGQTPSGAPFFVMELLTGSTLSDLVARHGPLPWHVARDLLRQLAQGLAAVHERGIVHRDLKPDNVFVLQLPDGSWRAKIIDFGIAKTTELDAQARAFTRTGMVFGTPSFMSPEQARGEKVDLRADIYAVGCLGYYLLTGKKPFQADNATAMLFAHLFTEAPAPSQQFAPGAIPPEVDAIVLRCMRKDRQLRFRTMHELAEALDRVGSGAAPVPVPAEPSMPPGAAGVAGVAAELSGWHEANLDAAERPVTPTPEPAPLETVRTGSGRVATVAGVVVVLAALVGGGAYAWQHRQTSLAPASPSESEPASPPAASAELPPTSPASAPAPAPADPAPTRAPGEEGATPEPTSPRGDPPPSKDEPPARPAAGDPAPRPATSSPSPRSQPATSAPPDSSWGTPTPPSVTESLPPPPQDPPALKPDPTPTAQPPPAETPPPATEAPPAGPPLDAPATPPKPPPLKPKVEGDLLNPFDKPPGA